jgi:hypothetical protein
MTLGLDTARFLGPPWAMTTQEGHDRGALVEIGRPCLHGISRPRFSFTVRFLQSILYYTAFSSLKYHLQDFKLEPTLSIVHCFLTTRSTFFYFIYSVRCGLLPTEHILLLSTTPSQSYQAQGLTKATKEARQLKDAGLPTEVQLLTCPNTNIFHTSGRPQQELVDLAS